MSSLKLELQYVDLSYPTQRHTDAEQQEKSLVRFCVFVSLIYKYYKALCDQVSICPPIAPCAGFNFTQLAILLVEINLSYYF